MNRMIKVDTAKRATNVTLPVALVEEAKGLGINVSKACEAGLSQHVSQAKAARWRSENRDAIESYNNWVAENGVPYDDHRQY